MQMPTSSDGAVIEAGTKTHGYTNPGQGQWWKT